MINGSSCGEANHERARGLAAELGATPITVEVDGLLEGAPAR
jgi:hypothetical protein